MLGLNGLLKVMVKPDGRGREAGDHQAAGDDGAAGAGDARLADVGGGEGLVAGRARVALKMPTPPVKRAAGRQDDAGGGVAAGELDGAGIGGGGVAELVLGHDGEAERHAGGGETARHRRQAGIGRRDARVGRQADGGHPEVRGGPGLTTMVLLAPVMLLVTVSVAVMVWLPAVFRLAAKTPLPPVKVVLAGRPACVSLLVKWTVPV